MSAFAADTEETCSQVLRKETERTLRHMEEVVRRVKEELRPLADAVRATIPRDR